MLVRWGVCPGPAQVTAAPGTVNYAPLDTFTLVHASFGLVLGALGLRFFPVLLLAVGWEIAEHLLKDCVPAAFVHPTQDTIGNAAADVVATVLAWAGGRRARGVLWRPWVPATEEAGRAVSLDGGLPDRSQPSQRQ
jgi:hypothetical protein